MAIEAIVLVPSVYRHEQELLTQLAELSAASLTGILANVDTKDISHQGLLQQLAPLENLPFIVGASLYYKSDLQTGKFIGQFGIAPVLTYAQLGEDFQERRFHRKLKRYDSAWVSPIADGYVVIICHDTSQIRAAILRFVGNTVGLVVIISSMVTLATMAVLPPLLITPILELQQALLDAAPAALKEDSLPNCLVNSRFCGRTDELGQVQQAFEEMFAKISKAIAQRQQAEAKLRDSESRFQTFVEQAAETILVVDRQGQILDANQFASHYLGYSDLKNRSIFEINPHLTRKQYQAYWQRLQSESPITTEATHRCKDGHTYPVEIRSSLIQSDGELRVLSLVRDIRDRKKAQASQARLAEIGELAAMIIHEVRNPLATIYVALTGFSKLDLPKGGRLRLQLAMEEAERLKRLLNEILTYSKEQRLAGEGIEINGLCQELYQSLRQLPATQEREVQLKPCSEKLMVNGDRDKLKQVLINLVSNACEAIAVDETVDWTIQRIHQQVEIQIHNGGEPIPPDILPKLTQPFVSTKESGNGLGLAITKRIIQAHGGSLTISSNVEEGTVVTVRLPIADEPYKIREGRKG